MRYALLFASLLGACRGAMHETQDLAPHDAQDLAQSNGERAAELSRRYLRTHDCNTLEMLCTLIEKRAADLRLGRDDRQAQRRREIAAGLGQNLPSGDADLALLKARYRAIDAAMVRAADAKDLAPLDALVADAQRLGHDLAAICPPTVVRPQPAE